MARARPAGSEAGLVLFVATGAADAGLTTRLAGADRVLEDRRR
jgi:hypothetical protein